MSTEQDGLSSAIKIELENKFILLYLQDCWQMWENMKMNLHFVVGLPNCIFIWYGINGTSDDLVQKL